MASGFSQTTCLPAARQRRAWAKWCWFGEVTLATWTDGPPGWVAAVAGVAPGFEIGIHLADQQRGRGAVAEFFERAKGPVRHRPAVGGVMIQTIALGIVDRSGGEGRVHKRRQHAAVVFLVLR